MFIARLAGTVTVLVLFTTTASAQTAKLSDPQIAHIAYTAGVLDRGGEVSAEEVSKQGSHRLRATSVRDHEAANQKALALVKKLNVTPVDNDVSKNWSNRQMLNIRHFPLSMARPSTRPMWTMRLPTTRR